MARKPRIGLALRSGSSRGWAHIGAIRALEERGVKPDLICGTSIGALVGAVYASHQLDQLEEWVTGLAWTQVVRLMDITWKGGLIRGQRLFNLFRATFQDREIAELDIPFGAIATELYTGREIWMRQGKQLDGVRAPVATARLDRAAGPCYAGGARRHDPRRRWIGEPGAGIHVPCARRGDRHRHRSEL